MPSQKTIIKKLFTLVNLNKYVYVVFALYLSCISRKNLRQTMAQKTHENFIQTYSLIIRTDKYILHVVHIKC